MARSRWSLSPNARSSTIVFRNLQPCPGSAKAMSRPIQGRLSRTAEAAPAVHSLTESARAWLRLIPMRPGQTSWKIFILMRPVSLRSLVLALSALLKLELVRLQIVMEYSETVFFSTVHSGPVILHVNTFS